MLTFLQRKGVQLVRCEGYSDYYSNAKGGNARGRSVEGVPFDARQLGEWHDKLQPSLAKGYGLVVKTNELRSVQYFNRSPQAFAIAARVFLRTQAGRLRRQELLTNGASLMGQMLKVLIDLTGAPPVWTNTTMDDLVVEDGRVVGVRATRDGAPVLIEARKGVLLAAGGFAHNAEMRRKYSGNQPNEAQWSIANAGDTGEVLETAMRLGRQDRPARRGMVASVDPVACSATSSLVAARQRPGAIFVDSTGQRFCNESNSYVEVGKAMYAHKAVPCWLIFDEGYCRRYARRRRTPCSAGCRRRPSRAARCGGRTRSRSWRARSASTPTGWSARCSASTRTRPRASIPTSGGASRRTTTALGDPGHKPNAALGPLDRSPYYATEIYPGDVGTCGGLITNEHAQVLDETDTPIPGLYATGNVTATVMGRTYPGAGASIANTMVFGYVAAHHAAGHDAEVR